jgi:hypothetical protein
LRSLLRGNTALCGQDLTSLKLSIIGFNIVINVPDTEKIRYIREYTLCSIY